MYASVVDEAGAMATPSCPRIYVVTPWRMAGSWCGSANNMRSPCTWASMNPGATTQPPASIRSAASACDSAQRRDPIAADADVAMEPRAAAAVDNASARDEKIEHDAPILAAAFSHGGYQHVGGAINFLFRGEAADAKAKSALAQVLRHAHRAKRATA